MPVDLTELRTELDTDPLGLGYAGMDDVTAADTINATVRSVEREFLDSAEVVPAIDPAEWPADQAVRDHLALVLGLDRVNVREPNIRALFGGAFPAGSNTRDALVALQTRDGTRAEELFGLGASVTPSQVADARRL